MENIKKFKKGQTPTSFSLRISFSHLTVTVQGEEDPTILPTGLQLYEEHTDLVKIVWHKVTSL